MAQPEVFVQILQGITFIIERISIHLDRYVRVKFSLTDEQVDTVYVVVQLVNEEEDALLDKFIEEEWAVRSVLERSMITICREFV